MKYWAIITVGLYGLLLLFCCPAAVSLFGTDSKLPSDELFIWLFLGILLLAEAALLVVPVKAAGGRPVTKRPLWITLGAASFFAALLFYSLALTLLAGLGGDKGLNVIGTLIDWIAELNRAPQNTMDNLTGGNFDKSTHQVFVAVSSLLLLWSGWAALFYKWGRHQEEEQFVIRVLRGLLRGSILELLIAVPCHIMARQRRDCCADGVVMVGLATGLSVMFAVFGPSVFFLYAARRRKLQPKEAVRN